MPPPSAPSEPPDIRATAGLCGTCQHAIVRPTKRGTVYLRCGLAAVDDRFARYPRLPVTFCPGYESGQPIS